MEASLVEAVRRSITPIESAGRMAQDSARIFEQRAAFSIIH